MNHIFVIHGIRDNDEWGQRIAKSLTSSSRSVYLYPYNYFSLLSFTNPFSRWQATTRMAERIRRNLEGKYNDGDTISFVGHSFGTHLIFRFVDKYYNDFRIESVVFISSVLSSLLAPTLIGKCHRFHNFAATKDWVLILNNLLPFPSTGLAGRIGCACYVSDKNNRDAFYETDHGGWFHAGEKRKDDDWFIRGALLRFFNGESINSEIPRPKLNGWIAGLLNLYKLIIPTLVFVSGGLIYHALTYPSYSSSISSKLRHSTIDPVYIMDLALTEFSPIYDLVGGGRSAFEARKQSLLTEFVERNITSKFIDAEGFQIEVSRQGQSAIAMPMHDAGPALVLSVESGIAAVDPRGTLIPAGSGYIRCNNDKKPTQAAVFNPEIGEISDSTTEIECSAFEKFQTYSDTWGLAINDRAVYLGRRGDIRISANLSTPALEVADGWSTTGGILGLEGVSLAADGAVPPFTDMGESENYIIVEKEEGRIFLSPTNMSFYKVLLRPALSYPGLGDEVEIGNMLSYAQSRYDDSGRVLVLFCDTESCEVKGADLPPGRAVSEVNGSSVDEATCQLTVGFQGARSAPILSVPELCNSERAAVQATPLANFPRKFIHAPSAPHSVLLLVEDPKRPSSRPRYEFSDLLAVVECPLIMPGQRGGSFFVRNRSVKFVCDEFAEHNATVDKRGITNDPTDPLQVHSRSITVDGSANFKNLLLITEEYSGSFHDSRPRQFSVRLEKSDDIDLRVEKIFDNIFVTVGELYSLTNLDRSPNNVSATTPPPSLWKQRRLNAVPPPPPPPSE